MQRKQKPLSPLASVVLITGAAVLGFMFLLVAFIGIVANPWGVLSGILLGSVLYYIRGWKE